MFKPVIPQVFFLCILLLGNELQSQDNMPFLQETTYISLFLHDKIAMVLVKSVLMPTTHE